VNSSFQKSNPSWPVLLLLLEDAVIVLVVVEAVVVVLCYCFIGSLTTKYFEVGNQ
jgi:hypothetical protein